MAFPVYYKWQASTVSDSVIVFVKLKSENKKCVIDTFFRKNDTLYICLKKDIEITEEKDNYTIGLSHIVTPKKTTITIFHRGTPYGFYVIKFGDMEVLLKVDGNVYFVQNLPIWNFQTN